MRPRKHDRQLPACVYHRHGSYYHVTGGKWHNLGPDLKAALVEYAQRISTPTSGMVALIREAMPSVTARVAAATKVSYSDSARRLESIFAEFAPHEVLPKHIAQMRRAYLDRPATGNHLLTVLRLVMAYAVEEQLIDFNPCIGIKPLPPGKRDRLIGPDEFDAIYAKASPRLQCFMDLLRLTGQRVSDVLNLKRAALGEEGIYFKQQKTGAKLIVAWSPELRRVVERAKSVESHGVSTMTVFSQRGGRPLKLYTIRQQWDLACTKAGVENAQLRDLRAMAGTEAKRQGINPTALLGHADPKMTRRYLRDRETPVVEGPSFGRVQKDGT
jgi:integrase